MVCTESDSNHGVFYPSFSILAKSPVAVFDKVVEHVDDGGEVDKIYQKYAHNSFHGGGSNRRKRAPMRRTFAAGMHPFFSLCGTIVIRQRSGPRIWSTWLKAYKSLNIMPKCIYFWLFSGG